MTFCEKNFLSLILERVFYAFYNERMSVSCPFRWIRVTEALGTRLGGFRAGSLHVIPG